MEINFYKNRVCLNVLAGSVANAIDCYEAAQGNIVVGVLSSQYPDVKTALEEMTVYQKDINNAVSVGLGAGNPLQSEVVTGIARELKTQHYNQVFTGVGQTRAAVGEKGWINALVSPSGTPGTVLIGTGPESSKVKEHTAVDIYAAIALIKDMGGQSVKFFPMKGLAYLDEYRAVAKACAETGFALEPTGGIDLDNFEEIMRIALDEGVERIIPHVYSSIIDPETNLTRPEQVRTLHDIVVKLVG